jgi:hypothetical protein
MERKRYLLKLCGETVEESDCATDGQIDVQIFFVSKQGFHAENVVVIILHTFSSTVVIGYNNRGYNDRGYNKFTLL